MDFFEVSNLSVVAVERGRARQISADLCIRKGDVRSTSRGQV